MHSFVIQRFQQTAQDVLDKLTCWIDRNLTLTTLALYQCSVRQFEAGSEGPNNPHLLRSYAHFIPKCALGTLYGDYYQLRRIADII